MTNKFKVGDKVKIVNPMVMDKEYKNEIVTIKEIEAQGRYRVEENNRPWLDEELDIVERAKFTKDDLQDGDILTLRNGKKGIYSKNMDIDDLHYDNIENDLTNNGDCGKELDIVKVERPLKYETVYVRKEVKEMTLKEVCEKLGYEVKIVKEGE